MIGRKRSSAIGKKTPDTLRESSEEKGDEKEGSMRPDGFRARHGVPSLGSSLGMSGENVTAWEGGSTAADCQTPSSRGQPETSMRDPFQCVVA